VRRGFIFEVLICANHVKGYFSTSLNQKLKVPGASLNHPIQLLAPAPFKLFAR
jgi:hypothetical protein